MDALTNLAGFVSPLLLDADPGSARLGSSVALPDTCIVVIRDLVPDELKDELLEQDEAGLVLTAYEGACAVILEAIADLDGLVLSVSSESIAAFWHGVHAVPHAHAVARHIHQTAPEHRIGIGVGSLRAVHAGGVFGRRELVLAGSAVAEAVAAVESGAAGVHLSPTAQRTLDAAGDVSPPKAFDPQRHAVPARWRRDPVLVERIGRYLPAAARQYAEGERTAVDTRALTVLRARLDLRDPSDREIHEFARYVQHALYRYEGSLLRLSYDGHGVTVLAAFGMWPLVHDDDGARAALAALRIQAWPAPVSVGLATGPVFAGVVGGLWRRAFTLFGPPVDRARQALSAQPGTIACDQATAADAAAVCDVTAPEALDQNAIFTIQSHTDTSQLPTTPRVELLGCEDAFAACHDWESSARRVLTVTGPPGHGKSSLVEAWLQESPLESPVFLAAREDDRYDAFSVVRELVAVLGLSRDQLVEACRAASVATRDVGFVTRVLGFERSTLPAVYSAPPSHDAVPLIARVVEAATEPHAVDLLVIEDTHWMDMGSRRVLHYLITAPEGPRLVLVGPSPVERLSSFGPVITLDALTVDSCADLLAQQFDVGQCHPDVPAHLHALAQGQPFAIREWARFLAASGRIGPVDDILDWTETERAPLEPPPGASPLDTIVAQLPPGQRRAAFAAAVLGHSFSASELIPLLDGEDTPENVLGGLVQRGILRSLESEAYRYAFRHHLYREAARRSTPAELASALHLAAAKTLASDFEGDLARFHHLREAGETQSALAMVDQVGQLAARSGNLEATLAVYSWACDRGSAMGTSRETLAGWTEYRAHALDALGQPSAALDAYGHVLQYLDAGVPESGAGTLARVMVAAERQVSRRLKAVPVETSSAPRHSLTARALERIAPSILRSGATARGLLATLQMVNTAEEAGIGPVLPRALALASTIATATPLSRLAGSYETRADTAAERLGHDATTAHTSLHLAVWALARGDWSTVERRVEECLAHAQAAAAVELECRAHALRALALSLRGHWEDATQCIEQHRNLAHRFVLPLDLARARVGVAELALAHGNGEAALNAIEQARPWLSGLRDIGWTIRLQGTEVAALFLGDQWREGFRRFHDTLELAEQLHAPTVVALPGLGALARVALREARRGTSGLGASEVEEVVARLAQLADSVPLARPLRWTVDAQLKALQGKSRDATRLQQKAQEAAHRVGLPVPRI